LNIRVTPDHFDAISLDEREALAKVSDFPYSLGQCLRSGPFLGRLRRRRKDPDLARKGVARRGGPDTAGANHEF